MGASSDSDLAPRLATHATVAAVRRLLESTGTSSRSEAYAHLGHRLQWFAFWKRCKAGKGLLPGTCSAQRAQANTVRLIAACLAAWRKSPSRRFLTRYTWVGILKLAQTDDRYFTLSEPVAMDLLLRVFQIYREARYERLMGISNGYLYNLRRSGAFVEMLGRRATARPAQAPTDTSPEPRQEGR